jgi:biopolymer transport protein ExbD
MRMQTRRPKEDPEINLISLIDIALLLVIFFMLSSTFMQEGRLKIELPQATVEESPAKK